MKKGSSSHRTGEVFLLPTSCISSASVYFMYILCVFECSVDLRRKKITHHSAATHEQKGSTKEECFTETETLTYSSNRRTRHPIFERLLQEPQWRSESAKSSCIIGNFRSLSSLLSGGLLIDVSPTDRNKNRRQGAILKSFTRRVYF